MLSGAFQSNFMFEVSWWLIPYEPSQSQFTLRQQSTGAEVINLTLLDLIVYINP